MLLRSSSTPVLGSLIPQLSHSDNHREKEGKANFSSENANQFYFHNASSHITSYSSFDTCSVEEEKETIPSSNFRRVQSESDLRSLSRGSLAPAKVAPESLFQGNSFDNFKKTSQNPWTRRVSAVKRLPSLKAIPSFSCYCDDEALDEHLQNDNDSGVVESQLQEFSFENEAMGEIVGRMKDLYRPESVEERISAAPLFMARGLGLDVIDPQTDTGGSGGNSSWKGVSTGGSSGNDGFGAGPDNIEEHFQRMLEENPGNSLLLRNYAQYLYESKHLPKAEEYYSRAILAEPDDGDLLAQYAKLIWELHHDEDRASTYFEQAVQASPEDCHVAAAYASFLWDTDTEEQEQEHSSLYNGTNVLGTLGYATTTVS